MYQFTDAEKQQLTNLKVLRVHDRSAEFEADCLNWLEEVAAMQTLITQTDPNEYGDIRISLNNLLGGYIEQYYRKRILLYTERVLNLAYGNHSKSVFALMQKSELTPLEATMFQFFNSVWNKDFADEYYNSIVPTIGYHAGLRNLPFYDDLARIFETQPIDPVRYAKLKHESDRKAYKLSLMNEAGRAIYTWFGVDTISGIVAALPSIGRVQCYWAEQITYYFLENGGTGFDLTAINNARLDFDQKSNAYNNNRSNENAIAKFKSQFILSEKVQEFAFMLLKTFYSGHPDWNDIGELEESFDLHWKQINNGINEIQTEFIDTTIDAFLAGSESEYVAGIVPDVEIRQVTMDGLFKSISKAWNKFREKYIDTVGDFVESSVGGAFDATIGKIIPSKYYERLKGLTEGSLQILAGRISSENLNKVLNGVKDLSLISERFTDEMLRAAMRVGPIRSIDKYSGGLITSAKNLNKVVIKVVDTNGQAKIDWKTTAFDALKIGMAVMGGFAAVAVATGVNAVGEKTGLNETEWGSTVLGISATYLTGNVPLEVIAQQEAAALAQNEGVKFLVKNTGLGNSSLGRTVAELGIKSTMATIDSNQSFDEILKENAKNKAQEVATNRVNELIKLKSNGLLDVDRIQRLYELKDKSLDNLIADGQREYEEAVKKITDRANEAYLKEKLQAEMDRKLVQAMDETYGLGQKYGTEFLVYLIKKYGPKPDYDGYIVPEDFLDFQINVVDTSKPFTGVKYGKTSLLVAGAVAAAVGAAIALS